MRSLFFCRSILNKNKGIIRYLGVAEVVSICSLLSSSRGILFFVVLLGFAFSLFCYGF